MKTMQTFLNTSLLASVLALNLGATAAIAAPAQKTFATPAAAADALVTAARVDDEKALANILGASWRDVLSSGDAATDKAALADFVAGFERMNRWTAMADGSRVLHIGADNYPYPIPLVGSGDRWHFDAAAGEREAAVRRIGANELLAIDAIAVIANAEESFLEGARDGVAAGYARTIYSGDGKRDGLYWNVVADETPSPLAALGGLIDQNATAHDPLVVDGYAFRILQAQGNNAEGGARSYLKNDAMTDGFAVLATPVDYGSTGITSFMMSRDGVVHEKDLGDDTAKIAAGIQAYDPDKSWTVVE